MRRPELTKKLALSIAIIAVFAALHLPATSQGLLDNPFFNKLNGYSHAYLDGALARAAASYATARTINALVSVIQESQVQATILGAGVTIAAGQVLDPINDLIERFSWVAVASMTSLGVQKFLVAVGPWVAVKFLLSLALCALFLGVWISGAPRLWLRQVGAKILAVAVLIVFFIPAAAVVNQTVYSVFLSNTYETAVKSIDEKDFEMQGPEIKDSLIAQLNRLKLGEKIKLLQAKTAAYSKFIVDLLVVFVVQTFVLPLLTAWAFLKILGFLLGHDLWGAFQRIFRAPPPTQSGQGY